MPPSSKEFALQGPATSFKSRISSYCRIIKYVWEASPGYMTLAIFLSLLSATVAPSQIWISKIIIDRISEAVNAPAEVFVWSTILTPLGILFLILALGGLCQTLSVEANMFVAINFRNHAEYLIMKKSSEMDLAFFETPAFYDKMDNALRNVTRAHNLSYTTVNFLGSFLSLTGVLLLLIKLHPAAILILLVTSAPQAIVRGYFSNKWYKITTDLASFRRMTTYIGDLLKSKNAVKEIRLFGLNRPFLDRFQSFWHQYFLTDRNVRLAKEKSNALLGTLASAGAVGIWLYAVAQAIARQITIGDVALVFQATESSRSRLSTIFKSLGSLYESTLFATHLLDFLDLKPDSVEGALARKTHTQTPSVPHPFQKGIEFRNVSFHYPRSEQLVLKNLSFLLKPNESIAVVGNNGAGKTTLVKLLARFYDPTEGEILLDGKDLRDYDLDDLRKQIGVIFQDFVRYDLSARENIGFGQIDHIDDHDRLVHAAQQGGATPIIEKLPSGFDTVLGRTFDEGVDLSGGEWQKMALSRAFMRNAQILILDEPTAALDAFAEYEIYNRFAELTSGKMTIFISHRFSTVRVADHILVLQDGNLIEEGTHNHLVALDGQYAKMFDLQAERYR